MYRKQIIRKTSININESTEGETLEQKIERIVNNGEPIKDGAPIIYTERKDGVQPSYDIRTDRFDAALDAMDKVTATHKGKREERQKKAIEEFNEKNKKDGENTPQNGKTESTQGTTGNPE